MAHLYRGEIHRMKLWRERLDRTTNWAISSPSNPHYIILVEIAMLGVFFLHYDSPAVAAILDRRLHRALLAPSPVPNKKHQ